MDVFGFVFPREFSSLFRVSRGQFVLLRLLSCGWLRGERPADRRALESAVAKTGSVASRSYREFKRVKPCSRESESVRQARCFKLSGFRYRPQAAGPIRASVRGGAPPARLVFARHFHVTKNNLFLPLY